MTARFVFGMIREVMGVKCAESYSALRLRVRDAAE
jgi:hypothetical protein